MRPLALFKYFYNYVFRTNFSDIDCCIFNFSLINIIRLSLPMHGQMHSTFAIIFMSLTSILVHKTEETNSVQLYFESHSYDAEVPNRRDLKQVQLGQRKNAVLLARFIVKANCNYNFFSWWDQHFYIT